MVWPFKKRPDEQKASAAGSAIAAYTIGQPVWTPRQYDRLADEGFIKNVIAYACVMKIASGAASVPWIVQKGEREVGAKDPLLKLLKRPNPMQGGADYFEALIAYRLIAGNAYIEAVRPPRRNEPPMELHALRPDRMRVIPGAKGMPQAYEYEVNGIKTRWDVNKVTGQADVCHWRGFHPTNDWYGLSPIEPGAYSIDQHNSSGAWNQALLQNGARPSGAVVFKQDPGKENLELARQKLLDMHQGARHAGKPIVLGGDVEWLEMMVTQRDMDFYNVTLSTARNICRAFGVPPVLIIEGEGTFSNKEMAQLELWEDTILPLLDRLADTLNNWLAPMFGDGYAISYDADGVSALTPRRVQKLDRVTRLKTSGIIGLNEAREELGYDTVQGGDLEDEMAAEAERLQSSFQLSKAAPERKEWIPSEIVHIADELDRHEVNAEVTGLTRRMLDDLVMRLGAEVVSEIGEKLSFEATARVQNYIRDHGAELVRRIDGTTKMRLRAALADGFERGLDRDGIAGLVSDVFADAFSRRAGVIAQTETTRAAGFSAGEAIKQAGLSMKEWVATQDNSTRDTHSQMDGQVAPSDGVFQSPSGATAEFPGAFGVPEEDINCRCAVIASFDAVKARKAMTQDERKALWNAREEKRRRAESLVVPVMRKVFKLQRDAVLKRLREVTS